MEKEPTTTDVKKTKKTTTQKKPKKTKKVNSSEEGEMDRDPTATADVFEEGPGISSSFSEGNVGKRKNKTTTYQKKKSKKLDANSTLAAGMFECVCILYIHGYMNNDLYYAYMFDMK